MSTQNLINSILGDGARPSKFSAQIHLPEGISNTPTSETFEVLLKNTSIPGRHADPVLFMYRGKPIPLRGQVKFDQTIEMTFHLEENHKNKILLEHWLDSYDFNKYEASYDAQIREFENADVNYRGMIVLQQLDFDLVTPMVEYKMMNAFPTTISSIEMNQEAIGSFSEVTITFSFSHYTVDILSDANIASDGDFNFLNLPEDAVAFDKKLKWAIGSNEDNSLLNTLELYGSDFLDYIGFDDAKTMMSYELSEMGAWCTLMASNYGFDFGGTGFSFPSIDFSGIPGMSALGGLGDKLGLSDIHSLGDAKGYAKNASNKMKEARSLATVGQNILADPKQALLNKANIGGSIKNIASVKTEAKSLLSIGGSLF